jgi:hypothetical protein
MKKPFLLIISLLLLLTPVVADATFPSIPAAATVKMIGIIEPREVEIFVENEAGAELSRDNAFIEFNFPDLEEWEVSQTLTFSYSSHLAKRKKGTLSFEIGDIRLDGSDNYNVLAVSVELEASKTPMDSIEGALTKIPIENTFATTFIEGRQDKTPIGTLTIRIRKRSGDVFSAGIYRGTFSMNFTEGS